MIPWRNATDKEKAYIIEERSATIKKSIRMTWYITIGLFLVFVFFVFLISSLHDKEEESYSSYSSYSYSSRYSSKQDEDYADDEISAWTYLLLYIIPAAMIDGIIIYSKKSELKEVEKGHFAVSSGQVVNKSYRHRNKSSDENLLYVLFGDSKERTEISVKYSLYEKCELGSMILGVYMLYEDDEVPTGSDVCFAYLEEDVDRNIHHFGADNSLYSYLNSTNVAEKAELNEKHADQYDRNKAFAETDNCEKAKANRNDYDISNEFKVRKDKINEVYGWFENMNEYRPVKLVNPVSGIVTVPGSKSMTNRALLLAALSNEKSILRGVLFSDDSRHFLSSLQSLGFDLSIDEKEKVVVLQGTGGVIPNKIATINVGSAGTAARFLTAMLALSDGSYVIQCSEQMEKRPMEELFRVLTDMGATFTYLKEPYHLPCRVVGNGGNCHDITMDISKSTQFLSAMLMVTPITKSGIKIRISSEKKIGAYVKITMQMLEGFGIETYFDGEVYHVPGDQFPKLGDYYIEPDVSAACYFYGLAALTGGKITVKNVTFQSVQGDMKFLDCLMKMGCSVGQTNDGIFVEGPSKLKGIDIDMNDFSDQALTLAAIAPFADSETVIRNVGHIRGQECDRIHAITSNLLKCGVNVYEENDVIHIIPGEVHGANIETFEDHRVAMSFTLLGLMCDDVVIKNPMCCRKTFEDYFDVLENLISKQV